MPKLVGIPYFNASEVGALEAGEELGIEVIYTGPTEGDAAQQVQMIEDPFIRGIDCITSRPMTPTRSRRCCKSAGRRACWSSTGTPPPRATT